MAYYRTMEERIELFWARIDRSGGDGSCWEWQGPLRDGYGNTVRFGMNGAHRVAWFLTHGDPGKLHVLHDCDNPRCCNPAHLHLGTHQDNMRDMVARGRHPDHPNSPYQQRVRKECDRIVFDIAWLTRDGNWTKYEYNRFMSVAVDKGLVEERWVPHKQVNRGHREYRITPRGFEIAFKLPPATRQLPLFDMEAA